MEKKRTNKKKPFTKRSFKNKESIQQPQETIRNKDNDPAWYLVNGMLAKNVANFTFDVASGADMYFTSTGAKPGVSNHLRMPGILTVLTGPAPGAALNEISPVNVAMRDIYSFVRHANSGHSNYDPADLMLYLLAADSVQTYWSYLTRVYGTAMAFSQRNRYVGDALLRAQGVNPTSIRSNMAQFLAYINQFALKASVLAVPNTMSYFTRHQWMYQNVYMDENNAKAQLFLYAPAYLFKYAIMDNGAGGLKPQWVASLANATTGQIGKSVQSRDFAALVSIGDALLNAMLTQEDVGIMSGDILKAYSSDKLFKYAQLDANYAIGPVFSEEVLTQLHNTNFTGNVPAKWMQSSSDPSKLIYKVDANAALSVTQDTSIGGGSIIWNPYFANANELSYTKILDLWFDDPTPEQALVAGRNLLSGYDTGVFVKTNTEGDTTYSAIGLQSCGSEIPINAVLWRYEYDGTLNQFSIIDRYTSTGYDENMLANLTKFNEHPLLRAWGPFGVTLPVGDITNYALVSNTEIDAMHNAALLSMFGVPYQW